MNRSLRTLSSDNASVHGGARQNHTLQRKILTFVVALNLASTVVACLIAFHFQKVAFIHGIDRVLAAGALGARHTYGDRFQRELLEGKQFTPEEELAHIKEISDLANQLGLNYIGAVVRREGKYYFTISSSPEYELEEGTYERFWAEYQRPSQALAETFEDGRVRFEDHADEFGMFRSAYIPFDMPGRDNVDYVYVADIGLGYIYWRLYMTLLKTAVAGVLISAFSLWFTWILAKRLAGPMSKLSEVICHVTLGDCQLADEQRSTLEAISANAYREVGQVSSAFVRMERRLRDYLAELEHTTAERQRIASELSIAHDIQMGLLPRTLPQLPGCDVFARVIPAKEVGGDLFDVAALDDHRLLVVVADVSGKGVSAGMFMAVTKTLLDVAAATCARPEEIVRFLNDRLSAENEACMFVTMFLGIFDAATGWLHYTNAGHNPPYLRRQNGKLDVLAERHGMALGIAGGQDYQSDVVRLAPGDLLLLYSDGITEAQDASESLFTEERLEACLRATETEAAGETASAVIARVREFQGAAPQFDDITIVALRYGVGLEQASHPEEAIAASAP